VAFTHGPSASIVHVPRPGELADRFERVAVRIAVLDDAAGKLDGVRQPALGADHADFADAVRVAGLCHPDVEVGGRPPVRIAGAVGQDVRDVLDAALHAPAIDVLEERRVHRI
jgi:hypothetical protein